MAFLRAWPHFHGKAAHNMVMDKFDFKQDENLFVSETDPEGSYTGNPTMLEEPEQDADDL